jgi:alanine racemase
VLPLGYADGLPRRYRRGRVGDPRSRCPLVGAISMDIAIADVTDPGARSRSVTTRCARR